MEKISAERRDELETAYKVAAEEREMAGRALTNALNIVSNAEKWTELSHKRLLDIYSKLCAEVTA